LVRAIWLAGLVLSRAHVETCMERAHGRRVPYAESNQGGFSRMVRRAAGIKDFHPHRCRHTHAMRWLAAGGSLSALQELLGHVDISTYNALREGHAELRQG
jgi:integrase